MSIGTLDRRELLRLSKVQLIRKCKVNNVRTTGSKSDMVDRLIKKLKCKCKREICVFPSYVVQFMGNLMHIFILYLDNSTLCTVAGNKFLCDAFNVKQHIHAKQYIERIHIGMNDKVSRADNLFKKITSKNIDDGDYHLQFAVLHISNYNQMNSGKDIDTNMRRISLLALLTELYILTKDAYYDRQIHDMFGWNKYVELNEIYLKYWKRFATNDMKTNKMNAFTTFELDDDVEQLCKYLDCCPFDSFVLSGKILSANIFKDVFMKEKVFGDVGKSLYSIFNELLLGDIMDLISKEWIIINGSVEYVSRKLDIEKSFSFIFGWLSPDSVIVVGGTYSMDEMQEF
eukprot:282075_1